MGEIKFKLPGQGRKRQMLVYFTPRAFLWDITQGFKRECLTGLPRGVEYRGAGYDADTQRFWICVEHPSFPEAIPGEPIPQFPDIVVQRLPKGEIL